MEQNELERLMSDCYAGLQYLLGNPRFPDADGAIVRIEKNIEALTNCNNNIAQRVGIIEEKQNKLISRIYNALPTWAQTALWAIIIPSYTVGIAAGAVFLQEQLRDWVHH